MYMLNKFFLAALLLLFAGGIFAQSPKARAVLDTEARRFEAMTRADTAALRPLLADDLLYLHSNALKETKEAHLTAIASRKLVYEKMQREEATVRLYGKTAVVNGTLKVSGILQGNTFDIRLLYTAVYRKSKGTWRLVNWQSTRLN